MKRRSRVARVLGATIAGMSLTAPLMAAELPAFRPGAWFSRTFRKAAHPTTPAAAIAPPPVLAAPPTASPISTAPEVPAEVTDPSQFLGPPPAPLPGATPPAEFLPVSTAAPLPLPAEPSAPAAEPPPEFLAPPVPPAPLDPLPTLLDVDGAVAAEEDVPFLDFDKPLPEEALAAPPAESPPVSPDDTPAVPVRTVGFPQQKLPAVLTSVPPVPQPASGTNPAALRSEGGAPVHMGGKISAMQIENGTLSIALPPDVTLEAGTRLLVYHRFNLGRVSTVCEVVVVYSEAGSALARPPAPTAFSRMAIGDTAIVTR